ncbi:MAG: AAA family ATPase [Lachnospiraceae bacterium]|jgi:predicted kinase|nr:AAA family ATPase [Lachnospiraceae bacterium]
MKKLLLITGDIAAGKSTFSKILAERYRVAVFQKDTVKEILGDSIGFRDREENKRLSNAAVETMCHIFMQIAATGGAVILEANFHEAELEKLHTIAHAKEYDVLTIVLRGDAEVLYRRYLHRMKEENRHPVHLTTTLDVKEDFIKTAEWIRKEKVMGETLVVEATDFSYQEDSVVLARVDSFMEGQIVEGV